MVSIIGDEVSDVIRAEKVYEREVLEFVRDRILDKVKCRSQAAIDVGANIGNHSLFLSDLFARVIAFEPNPLARSLLELNIGLNNVANIDVRAVGLSDQAGNTTLRFDPINLGRATSSESGDLSSVARQTTIDLVVGDDSLRQVERIGFIKLDIEGAEDSALRGLEQTLRMHSPIVMIEQWPDVIDQNGMSPSFSFLRNLEYSAWEIERTALFRGQVGKIPMLLLGRADYALRPLDRLQIREHPALIFTPRGYEFPAES